MKSTTMYSNQTNDRPAPHSTYSYVGGNWLKHTLLYSSIIFLLGCSERFSHSVQQVPAPFDKKEALFTDSTITLAAGEHYGRSRLHTFFYGKHYRDAWTTPVEIDVLDVSTAKGGLKPLQMGGSRQTLNLRTVNPDGIEYVLRSVDKEPASILSEKMQKSYLANIIRDATSATHPYAALTIPKMAEAIDIYHTNPELVYIPHDPTLGAYADSIGGTMALLERRPDGDQSNNPRMGNAGNIESTRSALTERLTDNDARFDSRFFLRARLLDMLIGDWSRHEDNWRWAEFQLADNDKLYKAIPRDRDNIYYKLEDALIPWIFMRLGLKPHFQTFRESLKHVEKLNRSGRNLDELLLADLTLQDWLEVADSVQHSLTDQVLQDALQAMPDTIYQITGPTILTKLKSRRDQLQDIATRYYKALSREVLIVGTDKRELFKIHALSPDQLKVSVYSLSKSGKEKQLLYSREFDNRTTKEVKLYGLSGDDNFEFKGDVEPQIKIRVWGGAGEDVYSSKEAKSKMGKKVHIVDTRYRNSFNLKEDFSVDIDDDLRAKEFNAEGWLLRYYLN